jgi:hypothetical protein
MSNASRQAAFRAAQKEAGFVRIDLWVPPSHVRDFVRAAALIKENRTLIVARLVDSRTGRLESLERKCPARRSKPTLSAPQSM